jgi:hypothetical protein
MAMAVAPARAQSPAQLDTIERQIQALQSELRAMKHDLAAKNAELEATRARTLRTESELHALPATTVASQPAMPPIAPGYALLPGATPGTYTMAKLEAPSNEKPLPPGTWKVRGVTVTLGGFIETTGIFRSRNEVADIASNFNSGIPLPNSQLYHENELRFTSRQSRISLNASSDPDPVTNLDAYFETDFISAAPTANSQESNSYNLRIRHLYAQYNRSDLGLHVMTGQTWSLLTMYKKGLSGSAGDANSPMVVDAQYVPGFTWARQAQFRVVKDWDKTFWLGLSVENPQTTFSVGSNGAAPSALGTVNFTNAGGSGYYSGNTYSDDVAPDVVLKAAFDQPMYHVEAYGVARFMHDRVSTLGTGDSHTVFAGGGGADFLLHAVPKLLDVQASFLAGDGIGRYGTVGLPDATIGPNGAPVPLPEIQALAGVVGHPVDNVDAYAYFGEEAITRPAAYDATVKGKLTPYGYGNLLYNNSGCDEELGTPCVGNTNAVWQATTGFWWKPYHSPDFGSLQVGIQYSYTHRDTFQGVGPTPKTNENMIFFSIRLFPFQDTAPLAPPAT